MHITSRGEFIFKRERVVDILKIHYTDGMVKKSAQKPHKKQSAKKVDFEPNKMTFAVATLAAVSLVLFAVIATYS